MKSTPVELDYINEMINWKLIEPFFFSIMPNVRIENDSDKVSLVKSKEKLNADPSIWKMNALFLNYWNELSD